MMAYNKEIVMAGNRKNRKLVASSVADNSIIFTFLLNFFNQACYYEE